MVSVILFPVSEISLLANSRVKRNWVVWGRSVTYCIRRRVFLIVESPALHFPDYIAHLIVVTPYYLLLRIEGCLKLTVVCLGVPIAIAN